MDCAKCSRPLNIDHFIIFPLQYELLVPFNAKLDDVKTTPTIGHIHHIFNIAYYEMWMIQPFSLYVVHHIKE